MDMGSYLKDIHEIEESARSVQKLMKERYDCGGSSQDPHPICTIAGADAAYGEGYGIGVIVLLAYPSLAIIEHGYAKRAVRFPYIQGLFAFRELPLIMAAYEKIGKIPDLLMVEGHGYAHPQRYGYACHAGAILGIPTIGIAKHPIRCDTMKHPGNERGMQQEILMGGEVAGMALRTRKGHLRFTFQQDTRLLFILPVRLCSRQHDCIAFRSRYGSPISSQKNI